MLAASVPVFDRNQAISAYMIFAEREEIFKHPIFMGVNRFDGATNIPELDVVNSIGIAGLADGRDIYIPVNHLAIFGDIAGQSDVPPEKIVLVLDRGVEPTDENLGRIAALKVQGFRIAFREISPADFGHYRRIFKLTDILFLDYGEKNMAATRQFVEKYFPDVRVLVSGISTQEEFDDAREDVKTEYFEGNFFKVRSAENDTEVSPLKATYIQLLNVVNQPDFDLTDASKVIGQDAALVVSLLEMVNRMTVNKGINSVNMAAAMLGQRELQLWINTAVTRELCSDKPSEVMRLSMIRAKFFENLAPVFSLAPKRSELFLLGMFSLLNVMLDLPMEEALKKVKVDKEIENALLNAAGPLYPVYTFALDYELASWAEVSRQILVGNLDEAAIYKAYLDALQWYRDILGK